MKAKGPKRVQRITLVAVALAIGVAGCGDGSASDAAGATTAPATAVIATTTAPVTTTAAAKGIHTAETPIGAVVADAAGFTLYGFLSDGEGVSACTGECAAAWPPLDAGEVGEPSPEIDAALLGEIIRSDGSRQATYGGTPLYRFAGDAAPGDVNGQGVNDLWYAVAADGTLIGAPPPETGSDYLSDY